MIPSKKAREVDSNGIAASAEFGISSSDTAHIMGILRDTLYSDKILAVIREYSSNAWDAHRALGKFDLPIKVTMPTKMDPTLSIRDFGPGLSRADVFTVYTQYGASTKRNNDLAVGMLGIGSKSGFAYADTFTITSWNGGTKAIYTALLDKSEKGLINLMYEEPCGKETGVEISIAIQDADIPTFLDRARKLFEFFDPRPEVNLDLPPPPTSITKLAHGQIREHGHDSWVAVMGCIPYRVNISQIIGYKTPDGDEVGNYLNNVSGILYFNIGDVQISASREELKYSNQTKIALVKKFNALIEEFVVHTLDTLDKGGFTPWDKRLRAQVLTHLELPIPDNCKDLLRGHVKLKTDAQSFTISRSKTATDNISISDRARIVIRDEYKKTLVGYSLAGNDYLITPIDLVKFPLAEVEKELEKIIKDLGIEGIPVIKLSSVPWFVAAKFNNGKKVNKKHKVSCFTLAGVRTGPPWSGAWDVAEHEPDDGDVFCVIEGFKTKDYSIHKAYAEDTDLVRLFGGKMPVVYGYKTTEKKPVTAADFKGTEYQEWRKSLPSALLSTPKVRKIVDTWCWATIFGGNSYSNHEPVLQSNIEDVITKLGGSHPISIFLFQYSESRKGIKSFKYEMKKALDTFKDRLKETKQLPEAEVMKAALEKTYPLLEAGDGISSLWGGSQGLWYDYIALIDSIYPL